MVEAKKKHHQRTSSCQCEPVTRAGDKASVILTKNLFDNADRVESTLKPPMTDTQRARAGEGPTTSRWIRVAFVVVGLAAWYWTQSLIGSRQLEPGTIGDGVHEVGKTRGTRV